MPVPPPLSVLISTPTNLLLSCSDSCGFRDSVEFLLFSDCYSVQSRVWTWDHHKYNWILPDILLPCIQLPHLSVGHMATTVLLQCVYRLWEMSLTLSTKQSLFTVYFCLIHINTLNPSSMNSSSHSRQNGSHTSRHYSAQQPLTVQIAQS